MKNLVLSVLVGALASAAAILLHMQLQPFGLIVGLLGSAVSIWALVHKTGQRSTGALAALVWIFIAWRAALPGSGGELLILGNSVGEILVVAGSLIVAATALISHPK